MEGCAYFETILALQPDGELTEREQAALEEHLNVCPACRALQKTLERMEDPASWEESPPPQLRETILAELRAPQKEKKHAARRWGSAAAMLAVILLAGSLGLSHMHMGRSADTNAAPNETQIAAVERNFSGDTGAAPQDAWEAEGYVSYDDDAACCGEETQESGELPAADGRNDGENKNDLLRDEETARERFMR